MALEVSQTNPCRPISRVIQQRNGRRNRHPGAMMSFVLQPWQLLLSIFAGWINDEQQLRIEYLRTENQVLKEKLGKKRILLNDDQRRRLAVKGKVLGRKLLEEIGTLFTPDTILRWHRLLVAQKWNYAEKRGNVGRPATPQEVVDLILQFARENPTWGYDRIADALANVGHKVSDQTVGNVLKGHGLEPAPERKRTTTWSTFLKAHWDQLAAIDFTTIEVWTQGGLVTYYLLFAMRLATRQVRFLGCTPNPGGSWMAQMARNLTDAFDGFLRAPVRYVLLDRDAKFTADFLAILRAAEVKPVLLPPKSPNCNAQMERFFRSLKEEALARLILFGESALRNATTEFLRHYHGERAHQGLDHQILEPGPEVGREVGVIVCRERLGGLLKYYHRQAA
jgi:putative transposase